MNNKLKTFFSVSLVIIIISSFHYIGWLNPIENFFRAIMTPGSKLIYKTNLKINGETEEFSSVNDLENAYKNIKSEFLSCQSSAINNNLLEQENTELRNQLNFSKKNNYNFIGAEVIGKNIDPVGSSIILNRGSSDGIEKDFPVIIGEGILVGKIIKVEEHTATARLINDNQSKVATTVLNRDKSIGLVEGGYGISVKMNYIPQNEEVSVGDIIVTSGLEVTIPKGLLIGTVEAVEKEAYQPFQKAILKTSGDLNKIFLVSIIKLKK
ncbi:MAG TPA: rod shape-determining protein MreC [Candidatus Magasanikbacteria bacterium]|nr:rod shape-determining protein MreC [Candidatus Magasanikbacteria bacterium]